ncbi:unnamed protein product [Symbiodinium pilosum]|uniref:Ubiquitin-like domain-containing protein n=1 Tax=Symbiodinium pilosum TaxID=2952 RepID=A0A812TSL8_SYMPI|nr:unnamed protein product [Symbiodinium pilosum]
MEGVQSKTATSPANSLSNSLRSQWRAGSARWQLAQVAYATIIFAAQFAAVGLHQADTGGLMELQVSTSMTVEALLRRVREAVGCGEKGRLLFRMRPLDANATLETSGIHKDPKALHFLLNRKHRPPEVVERAKREAAELSAAMAVAAAEAAARPRRQRQSPRPASSSSVQSDPPQLS